MKRILLTGVGSPASQNFLACLRMALDEFYVVGVDANRYHLEWGELDARYEAPWTSDPGYLDWLNALIEKEQIDFVHGQPDYEVAFLSKHVAEIKARTFFPRPEVIVTAQNKFAAVSLWAKAGLRQRPQLIADDWDFSLSRDFPVWVRATSGAGARGACKLENAAQGLAWWEFWQALGNDCEMMLEEYLPGREYAFSSLWYGGELICSSARERVEKCSNLQLGGAGVTSSPIVARSVHDERVNQVATQAIRALDDHPHGVYSVDLKEDSNGVVRPTECNAGRFFTTSLFLAQGGCNMPHLFVHLGMGLPEGPPVFLPYNALPAGLLWIRHIDCGQVLAHESKLRGQLLDGGGL